jgi:hypothetical protein
MAKVTNAFTSYGAQANREDLSDTIYNIDPFDTPVFSAIGKRNVRNKQFDWQTESLPAAATTADAEGYELSRAESTPTVRVSNVVQINHRDATVTSTQQALDPAGKKDELAHQMALVSKALKRDMESIVCGKQPRNDGEDSTPTARNTRALEHWIQTNGTAGTNYAYTNPTTAITDGDLRTLTEEMFNDTLEECYTNGGEPTLAIVPPAIKRSISTFTGRLGSQIAIGKAEAVNTVDLYKSDFGDIKIMPSRWVRTRTVLMLDPEYARIAYLRPFHSWTPAKIGSADTRVIEVEWGLQVDNEKAHAKIADIQA